MTFTPPKKPEQIADVSDALWLKALNNAAQGHFPNGLTEHMYTYSNEIIQLWIDHARMSIMLNEITEEPEDSLIEILYPKFVRYVGEDDMTSKEAFTLMIKELRSLLLANNE